MNWKRHAHQCLLATALLCAILAFTTSPALALKVEGARIALDVEPGMTYTSPIGISITADEAEGDFAIDVMGFGQSPTDGTYTALDAADDKSPYSARPLITVDKPTVHLKPGERADVTATISIPSGTRDGGRYAIILVHPAVSASGAPASFATAVAIPVLLTLKAGTISEAGEISALEPAVAEVGKPFSVVATFRNSGNYHYYGVVHNVTITDVQNKIVSTKKTTPLIRALVPGQSVKVPAEITGGLPQGNYEITSRMETQDGKLLAEKMVALQAGSPATPVPTTPATTGGFLPGFGAPITILGISAALSGILWSRRGERR